MTKPLVIYHSTCADGFGAAWSIWRNHRDWEFFPGVYGENPPDVLHRDVYLVDFSYKRPVLLEMLGKAKSITIIDHHKTAQEDLAPLFQNNLIQGVFDMNHSGAMLTWHWFNPDEDAPPLLFHIEDRDLWRFKLAGTREIQAALFSYPYDFEVWNKLMSVPVNTIYEEGVGIERKHHKDVAELVKITRRYMDIGGYIVPVASLPYTMASDAGNLMAKGEHFAACYYDTEEHRHFSLRSVEGGVDVSEVAKYYGGGGHKHAAGFRVDRSSRLAKS